MSRSKQYQMQETLSTVIAALPIENNQQPLPNNPGKPGNKQDAGGTHSRECMFDELIVCQ